MPKKNLSESVLNDWVHLLPFQMQALLLTGMRGPDENNKYNAAKAIVRYLRGVVIKPAGAWGPHRNIDDDIDEIPEIVGLNNNDFMWGEYGRFNEYAKTFFQDHDEYPHHFIMHLVHCAEVVGWYYPVPQIAAYWKGFYTNFCTAFHMNPETKGELDRRLNDFGCGVHNEKLDEKTQGGNVEFVGNLPKKFRVYRSTVYTDGFGVGVNSMDVTEEEWVRWPGEKEIIYE